MKNKLLFVIIVAAVVGLPTFFIYMQTSKQYYDVTPDIIRGVYYHTPADRPLFEYCIIYAFPVIVFLLILFCFIAADKKKKERSKLKI